MRLFTFYPQATDVGETHSLVPGTVVWILARLLSSCDFAAHDGVDAHKEHYHDCRQKCSVFPKWYILRQNFIRTFWTRRLMAHLFNFHKLQTAVVPVSMLLIHFSFLSSFFLREEITTKFCVWKCKVFLVKSQIIRGVVKNITEKIFYRETTNSIEVTTM
jgi:hypothetical protein